MGDTRKEQASATGDTMWPLPIDSARLSSYLTYPNNWDETAEAAVYRLYRDCQRMAAELCRRRAADLNPEEIEAIRFMQRCVNFRDITSGDQIAAVNRAFLALDRLVGGLP